MTDVPEPVEPTTQSEPEPTDAPDSVEAENIKRSWSDVSWYRGGVPYRRRP
jgi:hypothetical protein